MIAKKLLKREKVIVANAGKPEAAVKKYFEKIRREDAYKGHFSQDILIKSFVARLGDVTWITQRERSL